MKQLKHAVFWPPFVLLLAGVACSFIAPAGFTAAIKSASDWILAHFGWLFCGTALAMLLVIVATVVSPLASIRIGGPHAKPLLTRWRWFSIMLCTTVAIGILFWGAAEPLYHVMEPPSFSVAAVGSPEAGHFAMSMMFLHWTFTPYAIYSVPALVFALAYYNGNSGYTLGALIHPLSGPALPNRVAEFIDAICLYSLVAGMAAALGTGMLTLAGGFSKLFGIGVTPLTLGIVGLAIVLAFIASSVSGLMNGIRLLSDWNTKIFFAIAAFVFIAGPTLFIMQQGGASFVSYLATFIPRTLAYGASNDAAWTHSWTVFYWAVWMAWAPVTALFLGRISYGYTVREFVLFNFVLPALFGAVWMSIFAGSAVYFQLHTDANLYQMVQDQGVEQAVYGLFEQLPLAGVLSVVFLGISFLSFVTAADSNTTAMGGISSSGISPDTPEAPMPIKIAWGVIVGLTAWIMVSFNGIEGIRMSSNLGGFPALFLLIFVTASLVVMMFQADRYQGPQSSDKGD